MERFHQIEDGAVITHAKGVYQQRKLYRRAGFLYAGHGTGFVALYVRGGTSNPSVSWKDIDLGSESAAGPLSDALGRLFAPTVLVAAA